MIFLRQTMFLLCLFSCLLMVVQKCPGLTKSEDTEMAESSKKALEQDDDSDGDEDVLSFHHSFFYQQRLSDSSLRHARITSPDYEHSAVFELFRPPRLTA